ncbi:hypothetical protein EV217_1066 [Phyllobacterium myrsinacearum]|nr:hypothetical protein EV217_1066 [Phyllobacterium myrsinacearum]
MRELTAEEIEFVSGGGGKLDSDRGFSKGQLSSGSTKSSGRSKSSSSHTSVSTTTAKSSGFSGTLVGTTRGVDGLKLGTDCHYSTPVGGFTVSTSGWNGCDKTHPAPRGGGFGR